MILLIKEKKIDALRAGLDVEKMEAMVKKGKILRWGVSNFDTEDMEELLAVPGGENCCADQDNICAIPRSGDALHVRQNVKAVGIRLLDEDYKKISEAFPAPGHKTHLDVV